MNKIGSYKSWLSTYYKEALNLTPDSQIPFFWRPLTRETLQESQNQTDAAIVEDASIGLALLVVEINDSDIQAIKEGIKADLHHALSLRSKLLPEETGSQSLEARHDPNGTWRVAMLWLCPKNLEGIWKNVLMDTRRQSSIFDEIAVDAIFIDETPLHQQFSQHGTPCLLLQTRKLFKRKSDEVDRWASADEKVKEAFDGFEHRFNDILKQGIASGITQIINNYHPAPKNWSVNNVSTINRIEIENLRCIKHLVIDDGFDFQKPRAWIIHGPNGTGKSSIAEAIALKSFGTSFRYRKYLNDEDVTKNKNSDGYLSRYLRPIHISNSMEPTVRLTKNDVRGQLDKMATSSGSSNSAITSMEGTLTSQEDAGEFVKLTGAEMAERLATSFSDLAKKIQDFANNGYETSNIRRVEFNRRFGMTANTKLKETIRGKIAASVLVRLPSYEVNLIEWLRLNDSLHTIYSTEAKTLQIRLEEAQKKTLAENIGKGFSQLAALGATSQDLANVIKEYYQERLQLLNEASRLLSHFNTWRQSLGNELDEILGHCRIWAQWLTQPQAQKDTDPQQIDAIKLLEKELFEATEARKRSEAAGKLARLRFDHINAAQLFINEHWASDHPENCPTCNSHLSEGIVSTVEAIHAEADAVLNEHRKGYEIQTLRIKELQEKIKSLSSNSCPIPEAVRIQIDKAFSGLIGTEQSMEQWLSREGNILRYLGYIGSPPAIQKSDKYDISVDSQRLADDIITEWKNAEIISEEPDAWESIKKDVAHVLQSVVVKHLPETVERVWFEIALALTPARWLLPANVSFKAEERRGSRKIDVVADDRLVRYLFNNAEQHVLGLAWTFVRHLIDGRFHHAWLLLDDPAQEMDQPTFRELCRFLASLLRLYKTEGRAFTLITLLHQEERALDLARETDSGLYLLGWTREQGSGDQERSDVRRIRLSGPGTHSPKPQAIFGDTNSLINSN